MNYLFFDIECCNGKDICSFGYVLTDEEFNIIKKEDIVINPNKNFNLTDKKGNARITLAYSEDCFFKAQDFTYHYEYLKSILEDEKVIIVGHGVNNDINFLQIACLRYKLPFISFKVYNTQNLSKKIDIINNIKALNKIIKILEINVDGLFEHKSCDDAEMTMLVVKEICKRKECNVKDLIETYELKPIDSTLREVSNSKKVVRTTRNYYDTSLDNTESDIMIAYRKALELQGRN